MSNKPTREIKKGHVKWRFIVGHLLSSDCYFDSVIFLAMCVWAWGISHKARLELVEHELFIISWTIVICNRRLIWGRITAYLRSSKFSMSAKSELTHHNMPTVCVSFLHQAWQWEPHQPTLPVFMVNVRGNTISKCTYTQWFDRIWNSGTDI